jgi:hypothetical protein
VAFRRVCGHMSRPSVFGGANLVLNAIKQHVFRRYRVDEQITFRRDRAISDIRRRGISRRIADATKLPIFRPARVDCPAIEPVF